LLRPGRFLTLNLPVAQLTERVADIDRLGMTVIREGNEALGLLAGYCRMVMALSDGGSAPARSMVSKHLLDLASLAIGANRDAWLVAQDRGVRAARRLAAICAIRKNANRPDFRIAELARELKVSESYLRKLFAEVSQTFSSLLLEARLLMARAKLLDARFDGLQISQIAANHVVRSVHSPERLCFRFRRIDSPARHYDVAALPDKLSRRLQSNS